jgi:hypothetical protein
MQSWCCCDTYSPRGNLRKLLDLATQFYQLAWVDEGSQGSHMVLYESQPFSLQLDRGATYKDAQSKVIKVVAFLKRVLELQVASINSLSIPGAKRQCSDKVASAGGV